MRSERSEVQAKGNRARSLAGSRRGSARRSALRRLWLEDLESRQLLSTAPEQLLASIKPSTLPAPSVPLNTQIDLSRSPFDLSDESAPSIAIDKNNPQKLVAVWTRNDPRITGPTHIVVDGSYSTDGGLNWIDIG